MPRPVVIALSLFFFAFGSVFPAIMVIIPVFHVFASRSWIAVPCTITSSNVQKHSGGKGTTYSVDIQYDYDFSSQTYSSNRYDFTPGSSSGEGAKQLIAKRYPVGTSSICYVNPNDPRQAVLSRGMPRDLGFGVMMFAFPVAGLFLLWMSVRSKTDERDADRIAAALAQRLPETGDSLSSDAQQQYETLPAFEKAAIERKTAWLMTCILLFAVTLWNGFVYAVWLPGLVGDWRYWPRAGLLPQTAILLVFAALGMHLSLKAARIILQVWRAPGNGQA